MKPDKVIGLSMLCFAGLLIWKCSLNSPDHAGNISQTGNGMVAGILYEPDGKTPASGVRVVIRPRQTLADTSGLGLLSQFADTASVITDDSGKYVFDTTLDTGTYVIEAADGNNAVLIDSVVVQNPDSTLELPPDTLKPAGALKGVIRLSEGGDPRKVFVLAFGIDRFARVEADGHFRFKNLAEGSYDLQIISSLDNYGVLDTPGVPVRSGDTTNIDSIKLPFLGIPSVKGLQLSYDTLRQRVTLVWDLLDTNAVNGYNVYQREPGENFNRISRLLGVRDTIFIDSSAGLQGTRYEYRVVPLARSGEEGNIGTALNCTTTISSVYSIAITIDSTQGLYTPTAMVYDDRLGDIVVADYNENQNSIRLLLIDSSARVSSTITEQVLGLPRLNIRDIALGPDTTVILYSGYNIHEEYFVSISMNNGLAGWPIYLDTILSGIGWPSMPSGGRMATDSRYTIWYSSDFFAPKSGAILAFDTAGLVGLFLNHDSLLVIDGSAPAFFIDKRTDDVFVSNNNAIKIFDRNGEFRSQIRTPGTPNSLFVNPQGFVYAICGGWVYVYDTNHEFESRFCLEDGMLPDIVPSSIVADNKGRLFIADKGRRRISGYVRR